METEVEWTDTNNYLYGLNYKIKVKKFSEIKIAGFDLDDTLIDKRQDPWELIDHRMEPTLKELTKDNYLIIIFSNQSGMTVNRNFDFDLWKSKAEEFITNLSKELGKYYFIGLFVAKTTDYYRKPNVGMWNLMKITLESENIFGSSISINKEKSFYCGDAGGRALAGTIRKSLYKTGKSGDFSDTDRKFALNLGIKFYTPEELFFKEKPMKYQLSGLDPIKFLQEYNKKKFVLNPILLKPQTLVITVGLPGSGKSSFVNKYLRTNDYDIINQDTCHSMTNCIRLLEKSMISGKNVVIDNTNPSRVSRKPYIKMGRDHKYHIICLWFQTPLELAKHMNNLRHILNGTAKISDIVYHIFAKKFESPHLDEGFDEIIPIDFFIDDKLLANNKWKELFSMYSEA